MNPADFSSSRAGRCIRVPSGFWAFLPAPPPLPFDYSADLVFLLSKADAALSELSGLGRHLPNPKLLIAPYIRREAVLSSRIEGTRTTLAQLLLDEASVAGKSTDPDDVREVRNYVAALDLGIRRLDKLPLSLRLVREIHERLMQGVRGDHATPGHFRRSQNWIGPPGSTPPSAPYVPPPPEELMDALGAWEKFLHQRNVFPDLIQCAVMHEHFESLHPFLDGNGRVGRLMITLFLIDRGRLSHPLLYLSAYLESHRNEYYDALQRARTHGDLIPWIQLFLTGVEQTATEGVSRAIKLLALRGSFRKKLARKVAAIELLDRLFLNPYVTVAQAAKFLRLSNPSARQTVATLQKCGMLEEVTGRDWGKLFLARPILDVIDAPLRTTPR